MKPIENLLTHARNNEQDAFKAQFNALRLSLNVWDNGATPSETVSLICGNLIDRYDDLLTVMGCYWKTSLTSDILKSPSSSTLNGILKTLLNVVGVVQQRYTWEHVVNVCRVFLDNSDATSSPLPHNVVQKSLIQALGKLRNTTWLEHLKTLEKILDFGKITTEAVIVTAVQNGNDALLSALITSKGITPLQAIFVAANWSEKIAAIPPNITDKDASQRATQQKNRVRMFPLVSSFVNVEQILDCARVDNPHINLGHLRETVKRVDAWNGSDFILLSSCYLQQIDLILEHFEWPTTTKHGDLLNKLVLVCTDKYPQAQNWKNFLERQKLMTQISENHITATRKM